jgi:hypothetical protein
MRNRSTQYIFIGFQATSKVWNIGLLFHATLLTQSKKRKKASEKVSPLFDLRWVKEGLNGMSNTLQES